MGYEETSLGADRFEELNERAWDLHTRHMNRVRIGEPHSSDDLRFLALALGGEVGELQNMVKKLWRGDRQAPTVGEIFKEHGDILNYLILSARAWGVDLLAEASDALDEYESRFKPDRRPTMIDPTGVRYD